MAQKILLIEDDEQIRRMYQQAFEVQEFVCDTQEDGNKALDVAQQNPPDLILLDIMMPNIDGLAVLAKFKQDEHLKNIPIVMLTNLTGQEVIDAAMKQGAKDYINKSSLKPREVVEKVKQLLS